MFPLSLVIIPILVGLITQAIKLIIDGIPNNFSWQHIVGDYGGMPSSHLAFISSLAIILGLSQGFNSAAFALGFVLMIVVARDAVGFRREIGRNAVLTNWLAKKLIKDKNQLLNEQVGHNLIEATLGVVIGAGLGIFFYFLFLLI